MNMDMFAALESGTQASAPGEGGIESGAEHATDATGNGTRPRKRTPSTATERTKAKQREVEPQGTPFAPLAERLRPQRMADFVGQPEMVGQEAWLPQVIEKGYVPSLVLWGPPGTGKTTMAHLLAHMVDMRFVPYSGVTGSVPELRAMLLEARDRRRHFAQHTLLFLDEIHRFSKSQQDVLLPFVEAGDVVLIGATTENPAFYLQSALLSRVRVVAFSAIPIPELVGVLRRALQDEALGLGLLGVSADDEALESIARAADGDARRALNTLELATETCRARGTDRIDVALAIAVLSGTVLRHDRKGDAHYDIASALIKSMRGSDPDAAVYWMMRLLDAGDDPRFVTRRFMIFASEDVGNADPHALVLATSADAALHRLGMPEGLYVLSQCCAYLAMAPKSNASSLAFKAAREDIQRHGSLPVPTHLRNAPTALARQQGHGKGYRNPHDRRDASESRSDRSTESRSAHAVKDAAPVDSGMPGAGTRYDRKVCTGVKRKAA